MGKIILEGIEVYSFHGYSKEERKIGGKYRVDLWIDIDTKAAEQSDKLNDTINYERVFMIVQAQMGQPSKLIEHIGRKILDAISEEFPEIEKIKLVLSKLHPPIPGIMKSVAIELEYKK
jgi:dihydroneopterin aldolase